MNMGGKGSSVLVYPQTSRVLDRVIVSLDDNRIVSFFFLIRLSLSCYGDQKLTMPLVGYRRIDGGSAL